MVEKRTAQSDRCEGCGLKSRCQEAYERLGCVEGPSVTRDVTTAFLLPIVAFVVFLGVFGWLLRDVVAKPYVTPLAAAIAVPITVVLMLTVRVLMRRHRRK